MNWPSYHVWLLPAAQAAARFERVIETLARELTGPCFAPHITLVSDVMDSGPELIRRSEALAAELPALDLRARSIALGQEYFQCVYVELEPTPALMRARALALQHFAKPNTPYFPHLSLAYGDYPPARKQAVLASVPGDLLGPVRSSALALIRAQNADPDSWRAVCTLPLA